MAIKNGQEIKKNFFSSKTVLFFLLIALIWVAIICIKTSYQKYQMAEDINNMKANSAKLQEEMQKLDLTKAMLNNPAFLEKEAKQRLNLKKEGEEVVILPKNETLVQQAAQNSQNIPSGSSSVGNINQAVEKQDEPNWKKWWKYFFH
jgi:cell division protein FtsL